MGIQSSRREFWQGLLQAVGVTAYCSLVGLLFWKGNELFGKAPNYAGPVAFLLLFSVSGLICGLIVFYRPYFLFFSGKKKEAADVVLATAGWLFIFLLIFLSVAIFFRRV